jgi:hypothetical protein
MGSMVVGYFHIVRPVIFPTEADAVLVVDSNAVLTSPISHQFFKSISGRIPKRIERNDGVNISKLALRSAPTLLEFLRTLTGMETLS